MHANGSAMANKHGVLMAVEPTLLAVLGGPIVLSAWSISICHMLCLGHGEDDKSYWFGCTASFVRNFSQDIYNGSMYRTAGIHGPGLASLSASYVKNPF